MLGDLLVVPQVVLPGRIALVLRHYPHVRLPDAALQVGGQLEYPPGVLDVLGAIVLLQVHVPAPGRDRRHLQAQRVEVLEQILAPLLVQLLG